MKPKDFIVHKVGDKEYKIRKKTRDEKLAQHPKVTMVVDADYKKDDESATSFQEYLESKDERYAAGFQECLNCLKEVENLARNPYRAIPLSELILKEAEERTRKRESNG